MNKLYTSYIQSFNDTNQMQDLETYGPEEVTKWMDHVNLGTTSNSIDDKCVPSKIFQLHELSKGNVRDSTILEIIHDTGCRAKELCEMQIRNVNMETQQIVISEGKNDESRTVYFSWVCRESLSHYLTQRKNSGPYLFITRLGGPFQPSSMRKLLGGYYKRVNHTKDHSLS